MRTILIVQEALMFTKIVRNAVVALVLGLFSVIGSATAVSAASLFYFKKGPERTGLPEFRERSGAQA